MFDFIEKAAISQAQHLLTDAREHEPQITADLHEIASELSCKIIGLEHKFKTSESLVEKITDKTIIGIKVLLAQGLTQNEAVQESLNFQSETINDVLRYAFIFPTEKYVFGCQQAISLLNTLGYEFFENKVWNAWKNIGTFFDKGYRGINTTFISSQKQKFELQFHTEESFGLKIKTHKLYKELSRRKTSRNRRAEITKIMIESAKDVSVPQGVKKL
jgi:hypothetical protein